MPTDMTRLMVSIPPDVEAALNRLHAVTGKPRATIIRELLGEIVPMITELSEAMEAAMRQPRANFAKLQGLIDLAAVEVRQTQLDLDAARKRKRGRPAKKRRPPG